MMCRLNISILRIFQYTDISKGVLKYSGFDDSKTLKTIDVENNFVKSRQTMSTKARKNERVGWRKKNMQCVQQCSTWSRFFWPSHTRLPSNLIYHVQRYIPPPSAIDLIELRRLPLSNFYCTKQKYILLFIFLRAVKWRYRAGAMLHR